MDTSQMNPPKAATTPTWAKVETLDKSNALLILGKPKGTWDEGVYLAHEYISGWYSSPDLKVQSSSRQTASGNYGHRNNEILYESRTVIMNLICQGGRRLAIDYAQWLSEFMGQTVKLTVHDYDHEYWARGYCSLSFESAHYEDAIPGTLTVVCDDPFRYGEYRQGYANSAPDGDGGLVFDSAAPHGLHFPISFGDVELASTVCSVSNAGTHTAYPTITFNGGGSQDIRIATPDGQQLRFQGNSALRPLVFDCRNHRVSCQGVDVTRHVTSKYWPAIKPGKTQGFSIMSTGGGYIQIESYDTYL